MPESIVQPPFEATPDIAVLPFFHAIPGIGVLPVNTFVISAQEPVLVDTGMGLDTEPFMKGLRSVIDPRDLKWIWITHDDSDHVGSLQEVMEAAPDARLVINFVGASRMSADWHFPMDRVYFLNPGESLDVGDRKLTAVRPPSFDAPGVNGIFDEKAKVYFSVDACGAIIPSPAKDAADIATDELEAGFNIWHSVDAPWLHMVDQGKFAHVLDRIRELDPQLILSSHLPPARGNNEELLRLLAAVPDTEPFVGPNQAAVEAMMAQITQSGPPGPGAP